MDEAIANIKPDYVVFLVGVNDLSLSLRPFWRWDDTMSEMLLGRARGDALNWMLDHSRLVYGLHMLKKIHFDGTFVRTSRFSVPLPSEPVTGGEYTPSDSGNEILPSLPLFRKNVAYLIRRVREYGGTPVFLTQPLLIDQSPRWEKVRARSFWLEKERVHLTGTAYARLLDRFNEVLQAVCAEQGAPCFDLAAEVPHSTDHYYDMVHYNDAGARLVGMKVAAYLSEHVLAGPGSGS
jgi:lysophospholipase L1-like esterase